ncbi:hypothetical protein B9Z55_009731 [Caenorhabditis nigoni]|nr:hypothetical protein B9Z55_009731 [Caenorhabditis nigoni]
MNVYSVFVFAVMAISSVSGIINIGGGKKCGGGNGGYGSGIIIGAPKPGGNRFVPLDSSQNSSSGKVLNNF